ncbi:GNAT family N-acetyltransferase [Demequina aurantiaca]|uniref:GNAT family N-acetyltransferase n=1 Tax=Demequina aurantiaca TaxID=676200 RepID=UPI00078182B5|nr:GNAT family N-acetyltransferase [Demequina aurantiaca]
MTDSLLRRAQHSLAPLQRRDLAQALEWCAEDPVSNCVLAMHLETARDSGIIPPYLWAVKRRGIRGLPGMNRESVGIIWNGANLTAVIPEAADAGAFSTDDVRAEVAAAMVGRLNRPAALVGSAELMLDLWGRVEPWWGPAREVRDRQLSMALASGPKHVASDGSGLELAAVRPATMVDYDLLLPASVHMFVGEVGYDPMHHGRAAYEDRLRALVRGGRVFVQFGTLEGSRQVLFKADVGAVGCNVAQVQGVWVNPAVRGRGLSKAGMAAVVESVRATIAPTVSLYVNDFNAPAVAGYRAVGFEEVGTFATVMF